jgi:predicted N-acetyltransferase YhbS
MKHQLSVRNAEPSEFQAILELTLRAYAEFESEAPPGFWPQYMHNITEALLNDMEGERIIALLDDKLVGSVLVYDKSAESEYPKIRLLAVDPDLRRSGVAGALMKECENRLAARNHNKIILHTTSLMKTARAMYERHGYQRHPQIDFEPVKDFIVWGFTKDLKATPE